MMKAIELNSKTDKRGHLRIDCKLHQSEKNVRVIILMDDDQTEADEEKIWMAAVSNNPAFDFLKDPSENIYSLQDGEPFNG